MPWARTALGGAPRLLRALTWTAVIAVAVLFAGPGASSTGHAAVDCYLLTMNVGSGSGSVTNMPTSWGGCPTNQYSGGYVPALLAEPAPGYAFSYWSGADTVGSNPTTVTMIGDRKVTAYFAWNCYALTMNVGAGSGSVSATPTSAGGCPANQYPPGYTVTVLATSAPGYVFSSWSGADTTGSNPTTVTMIGDRKVTAYFASNCYTLTKNVGTGSGSVSAVPTSAGGCPANQYPLGYGVSLLANAAPGYAFSSWNGTANNNVNPTSVTMSGNLKVTANFAWNCFTLTRNVGSGSGSINRTPASSGGCPTDQYWPGTQVTLLAKPAPGSSFINWSGTNNNGANPSYVMMTGNRKVTAFFTEPSTPTNTPPFTATNTPLPTSTRTPTPTATPTNTPLFTATNTPLPTSTRTPTPTATRTNTPPPTPTNTPTPTATPPPATTIPPTNTPTSTVTPASASTSTATSTPTAANTPAPTSTPATTPCSDFDGDTVCDADDPDDDNDGCTDDREQGTDPELGGERDPNNFWDFFDVPAGAGLTRDGNVTGQDIFAVIARFNASDLGPGDFDRNSDPLSTPNQAVPGQDRANYHPAYDRGPLVGPDVWDLGPADGSITGQELFAVIAQFGHSCS